MVAHTHKCPCGGAHLSHCGDGLCSGQAVSFQEDGMTSAVKGGPALEGEEETKTN